MHGGYCYGVGTFNVVKSLRENDSRRHPVVGAMSSEDGHTELLRFDENTSPILMNGRHSMFIRGFRIARPHAVTPWLRKTDGISSPPCAHFDNTAPRFRPRGGVTARVGSLVDEL